MFDKGRLSQQEVECLDMFRVYDTGAHDLAALKTHVKKWEYVLHGGRPEFYPQDRKAMLTLLEFKNQRLEREEKRMKKQQEMKEKMNKMRGLK